MLVTDRRRTRGRELLRCVLEAVEGGVGWVQLREKDQAPQALERLALRVRRALPGEVRLSINGFPEVAARLGLGCHLPAAWPALELDQRSRPPCVGRSVHDLREARAALAEGIAYAVLGTIFPTVSKPGRPPAGLELVREVGALFGPIPVFAIGGIQAARVGAVLRAGASGVAVCGAILESSDPRRAAGELMRAMREASRSAG